MKTKMRKMLVIAAGFAALALVVALTPSGQALADGMMNALLVNVVNDAAHPVPVHDVGTTGVAEYRFVGVSTNAVATNAGIGALHAACQADFGPSARTCTTVEFVRSPEMAGLNSIVLTTQPFLQPVVVGDYGFFDSSTNERIMGTVDATGVVVTTNSTVHPVAPPTLNCNNWSDSTFHHSAVVLVPQIAGAKPTLSLLQCQNSPQPVVCCAPRTGN